MHVSIRLHLVHAVVASGSKAVSVLSGKRRALSRLRVQSLLVSAQGLGSVFGRGSLEARGVAGDRRGVGRVGASASTTQRTRTDGITAGRG